MKQQSQPGSKIIFYQTQDGRTRLEVKLENNTVWLSLNQIAELFQRDKSVVSKHIKNVYDERELTARATVAKFATVPPALFGVKIPAVNKHLKNVCASGELTPGAAISKMETVHESWFCPIEDERPGFEPLRGRARLRRAVTRILGLKSGLDGVSPYRLIFQ